MMDLYLLFLSIYVVSVLSFAWIEISYYRAVAEIEEKYGDDMERYALFAAHRRWDRRAVGERLG